MSAPSRYLLESILKLLFDLVVLIPSAKDFTNHGEGHEEWCAKGRTPFLDKVFH